MKGRRNWLTQKKQEWESKLCDGSMVGRRFQKQGEKGKSSICSGVQVTNIYRATSSVPCLPPRTPWTSGSGSLTPPSTKGKPGISTGNSLH